MFLLFIFDLVGFGTVQMVLMLSDSLPPQVVSNPALYLHLLLLLKCFVLAYIIMRNIAFALLQTYILLLWMLVILGLD